MDIDINTEYDNGPIASTSGGRLPLAVDMTNLDPMGIDVPAAEAATPIAPTTSTPIAASQTLPDAPIPVTQAGRPRRNYRLPARYTDVLPEPTRAVDEGPADASEPPLPAESALPRVRLIIRNTMNTVANAFGLWQQYQHRWVATIFVTMAGLLPGRFCNHQPTSQ